MLRNMTAMSRALLSRLDIPKALEAELNRRADDLLPFQVSDLAARMDQAVFAEAIETVLSSEEIIAPAPSVTAKKSKYGRRPVMALTLAQRVAYRAVTDLLEGSLVPARGRDDYRNMSRGPIGSGAGFVVITDLAHYYATLSVPLLQHELLARSGEWEVGQWLASFLSGISSGMGGIPQGCTASDRLADTYASSLLGAMYRRGYDCWRHADDFRIVAVDYPAAVAAIEVFTEEARALGLFVNDAKTRITSLSTYTDRHDQPEKSFTDTFEAAREKLTIIGPYDSCEFEPAESEVLESAAIDELSAWADWSQDAGNEDQPPTWPFQRYNLRMILAVLSRFASAEALQSVPMLLEREPQLTPGIAMYFGSLLADPSVRDAAISSIVDVTSRDDLTPWQAVWLVSVLDETFAADLDGDLVEKWTAKCFSDRSSVLRSYAGWSRARQGLLEKDDWTEWRNSDMNGPFSCDFINASALISDPQAKKGSTGRMLDDLLLDWGAGLASAAS